MRQDLRPKNHDEGENRNHQEPPLGDKRQGREYRTRQGEIKKSPPGPGGHAGTARTPDRGQPSSAGTPWAAANLGFQATAPDTTSLSARRSPSPSAEALAPRTAARLFRLGP